MLGYWSTGHLSYSVIESSNVCLSPETVESFTVIIFGAVDICHKTRSLFLSLSMESQRQHVSS